MDPWFSNCIVSFFITWHFLKPTPVNSLILHIPFVLSVSKMYYLLLIKISLLTALLSMYRWCWSQLFSIMIKGNVSGIRPIGSTLNSAASCWMSLARSLNLFYCLKVFICKIEVKLYLSCMNVVIIKLVYWWGTFNIIFTLNSHSKFPLLFKNCFQVNSMSSK